MKVRDFVEQLSLLDQEREIVVINDCCAALDPKIGVADKWDKELCGCKIGTYIIRV